MHIGCDFYTQHELQSFGFKHLGKNVKIKKNACIYFVENVSIGDHSRIDDFSVIIANGDNCAIGSYVHIASHCYIAAKYGYIMEDFSSLAPSVNIITGTDDYVGGSMTNAVVSSLNEHVTDVRGGLIHLEKHVIIGSGSVILPDVKACIGSSVGANSLVKKSLDPWGVYFGSPAKKILSRPANVMTKKEKQFLDSLH